MLHGISPDRKHEQEILMGTGMYSQCKQLTHTTGWRRGVAGFCLVQQLILKPNFCHQVAVLSTEWGSDTLFLMVVVMLHVTLHIPLTVCSNKSFTFKGVAGPESRTGRWGVKLEPDAFPTQAAIYMKFRAARKPIYDILHHPEACHGLFPGDQALNRIWECDVTQVGVHASGSAGHNISHITVKLLRPHTSAVGFRMQMVGYEEPNRVQWLKVVKGGHAHFCTA
ncbi:hypothetical protein EDB85DRAFT_1895673 [Lactarius pseudohatsudake]|nr:hypothetical protein EDB85DRAFT_1895673 [Lactarius pseudohatsudake]